MSIEATLARIESLQTAFLPRPPAVRGGDGAFAAQLAAAGGQTATWDGAPPTATPGGAVAPGVGGLTAVPASGPGGDVGARMVQLAQAEVGQAEQPPGSNDSPRIAEYRTATAGSGVGPWCAYFTSWIAKQAGAPVGEAGQGFGAVEATWGWAQRTGKAIPAGPGVRPQPGDLIVWGGRHIGLVESVDAQGNVNTIEGNSSDKVTRRTYGPDGGGATGYVRVGAQAA